ncbi:hypothetical protein NDN08_008305 [Rhodosorus marinus]|uniref:Membrane insertase YidC/Oxa/ALB C-terminal domain-containing protein n=1 Tax=Rhodosorus marinus TaxID=101924 RepID=A0AAV8V3R6_9RHOD|nr:hypothetical protein NDN08_008305 [Rhodosorus marinus]
MAAFVPSGVGLGGRARSSFVDSRVRLGNGKERIGTRVNMGLESADFSAMGDHIVRFHDSLVASTILLADAAAPAVEAVAGEEKRGLWGSFVKLIESSIVGIHNGLSGVGVPYAYGFSIILFTIGIKVLTLPLNSKQMESTMRMQDMQPMVKEIQAQYKDNPQVMNERLANLYKEENVNPLAGCLPVLAQTPIWIALYRALLNMSNEDLLIEPFFWVPSLQGPVASGGNVGDWLFPFKDGAPPVGWHDAIAYLILPLVLIVTQSYSTKVLTPPSTDPQTEQTNQILKFLPLILGWVSLSVPAGLTLYWVANNVLSTAQTVVLRKNYNEKKAAATPSASAVVDVEAEPVRVPRPDADGFSSKKSQKKKSKKRRK